MKAQKSDFEKIYHAAKAKEKPGRSELAAIYAFERMQDLEGQILQLKTELTRRRELNTAQHETVAKQWKTIENLRSELALLQKGAA